MTSNFTGPLFVVGMPRSGTKLMRALLNQHPLINLTLAESHFIPYFVQKFGNPPLFRTQKDLDPFVRELQQTSFFFTMRKAGYTLDPSRFLCGVECREWSAIFEAVFRHFGSKGPVPGTVWGDKTPGYVNHIPLLRELFPAARFLHVVRDPRDYCLSVRKSFKKSIYRAAARWREGVENAHGYGAMLGNAYEEVSYEALLEDPTTTMRQVASFVGVPYDDAMANLASAPEDLGDAKGHSRILTGNKGKYATQLSTTEIKRIEEVVSGVAQLVGYRLATKNVEYRPLSPLTLTMLKFSDGVASLRHHVVAEGCVVEGAKRLIHHYKRSSWRKVESV
jgi:sulfotransferase family protein